MISVLMVSLLQRMAAVSHVTLLKIDASGFVKQLRFWRKWLGFVRRKSFQTDPKAVPLSSDLYLINYKRSCNSTLTKVPKSDF